MSGWNPDTDPPVEGVPPNPQPPAPVSSPRGGRRGGDSNDSSDPEEFAQNGDLGPRVGQTLGRRQVYAVNEFNGPGNRRQGVFGDSAFDGSREGYGGVSGRREDFALEDWSKDALPPLAENELEFSVPNPLSFRAGDAIRSNTKMVGNFQWRLYVFPAGTLTTHGQQVSAFVEAVPPEGLDPRWMFQGVKYQITLINWTNYRNSVTKADTWTFSKDGIDRGWHDILRISELTREAGWLGPDNSLYFRASVYVRSADAVNANSEYNVRKETGYIGLKNHGATCYMNGLLQSLFHVGEFRRIVYSIDCGDSADGRDKEDPDSDSLKASNDVDGEGKAPPLIESLQNVFYKLQTSDTVVNCRELMKSFGWDTMDAFTQHDAQELNRILCDRLEEQMKGTPMDGSIKRLFEGEMENFIECIDVDYKSKRNETFYDIQLNIKGERGQELQNIEESLKDYTEVEILEGDNAYEAEGHGKQRARKGIRFLKFPPVLNLQLKRFHFDLEKMDMVKLNTRFEFQRKIDLSSFAPDAGVYLLHAVVVHSGDVNSGHYYVHIRPNLDGGWFKFDDDTVTPCSEYAAVEDNYGGNDLVTWDYFQRSPREIQNSAPPTRPRIHNAYMLVYVREDCAPEVLKLPDPRETNLKMVERCDREVRLAEQRRREKLEQQMKIRIKLVFEKDLCKMTGFWDHNDIRHEQGLLKMNRDQQVKDLALEVESQTGVSAQHLAFFVLTYRTNPRQVRFSFVAQNTALRSHIPQYSAPHFDVADPYLMVLCIMSRGYDMHTLKWKAPKAAEQMKLENSKPDPLEKWNDEQIILMVVKYFCVKTRNIVTLGCYYTHQSQEPLINAVTTGWLPDRLKAFVESGQVAPVPEQTLTDGNAWECWEEFGERDLHQRNVKRSARVEQLWSGDVVIWQVAASAESNLQTNTPPATPTANGEPEEEAPAYPVNTVQDYAAHLSNAIDVTVTLHDVAQPLCVDDIVANGHWGPQQRPQSAAKDGKKDGEKEEKPEETALALSMVRFKPPAEKELKMDLRWLLQHVTGTIAKNFNLAAGTQLWLFHGAPSSTCEEPLNTNIRGTEQSTLKDLQRNAMYITAPAKRPFHLHAVEAPVTDRGNCVVFVRFFDEAVREMGNCLVSVPGTGTVQDVLTEAKKHILPDWGISGNLRAFEVLDCRINKLYQQVGNQSAASMPVRNLSCYSKCNVFYNCLRVEADPESANLPAEHKLIEIFHCDRQSQQAFAQPFLLAVAPGEKCGSLKARCKTKLRVPDSEFKQWRLVRCGRSGRTHLKDEEPWDADTAPDAKLCLEHVHPNPANTLARQSRYNKPLTIKG
eukprot:CAMPEP_0178435934 /NCGR_PEP_ID=MMETSP0689_2-20121128/34182_1 /TAXON_ID=160604 /ORGANISM="Amphidinium massartii, Strain CS-259" /LENGTH=1320 /DNA_ID=CAMNT_0020058019 /DNA_START=92 /DNA_END=4054 /DNA_ORIENTATION=+